MHSAPAAGASGHWECSTIKHTQRCNRMCIQGAAGKGQQCRPQRRAKSKVLGAQCLSKGRQAGDELLAHHCRQVDDALTPWQPGDRNELQFLVLLSLQRLSGICWQAVTRSQGTSCCLSLRGRYCRIHREEVNVLPTTGSVSGSSTTAPVPLKSTGGTVHSAAP